MSRRRSARTTRLLRRVIPLAESLAEAWPVAGLGLLGRLGEVLADAPGTWRTPSEEDVVALLGELGAADVRRIRRAITSQELRNQALRRILARRGPEALRPVLARIEAEPLLRLRQRGEPVLLVGWHQGPAWTDTLSLARLGIPVLCPTTRHDLSESVAASTGRRSIPLSGDGTDAAFLKEALAELERGGVVEIHLDWRQARGIRLPALGRLLTFGAGAGWLARRTGAALVPVTRRWIDSSARSVVTYHEPLPAPDVPRSDARAFEIALLQGAVGFFDAWLRAHPETLRVPRIRHLLRLPAATPTPALPDAAVARPGPGAASPVALPASPTGEGSPSGEGPA